MRCRRKRLGKAGCHDRILVEILGRPSRARDTSQSAQHQLWSPFLRWRLLAIREVGWCAFMMNVLWLHVTRDHLVTYHAPNPSFNPPFLGRLPSTPKSEAPTNICFMILRLRCSCTPSMPPFLFMYVTLVPRQVSFSKPKSLPDTPSNALMSYRLIWYNVCLFFVTIGIWGWKWGRRQGFRVMVYFERRELSE